MSTTKLVDYDQFANENLKGSEPIPKELKKANETIKYNEIKLSYNYGNESEPVIQDLFFQGCVMTSTGITTKDEGKAVSKKGKEYDKKSHSMMLVWDLADKETRNDSLKALEKHDEVFFASSKALGTYKGKLKMHEFDAARPGAAFKNPVYWHRDENGEKVNGKNPNLWAKLRPFGSNQTLFTDLKGNLIDWKLLYNVNVTLLPCFHYEKIYIGSKASLQIFLASAVVLKISQAGSESRQLSTLERLRSKYGGRVEEVEAQLADLRMARQDTLHSSTAGVSSNTNQGGQSDFGDDDEGLESGKFTSLNDTNTSLQDFLSSAPSMNPPAAASTAPQSLRLNIQKLN